MLEVILAKIRLLLGGSYTESRYYPPKSKRNLAQKKPKID